MKLTSIDLNCDLGEVPGDAGRQLDRQLLEHVTSANVACGAHAGDADIMRSTVRAARDCGVAIGAHPGYNDPVNFGRLPLEISVGALEESIRIQIETLHGISKSEGCRIVHVKPHGALYHQAARVPGIAEAVCRAVVAVNPELVLVGLSGGQLLSVGAALGLRTVSEVFCDRNYLPDGSLVPRTQPNAIIEDSEHAADRIALAIRTGKLVAIDGSAVLVVPHTVGLHSDSPRAVTFARGIRQRLSELHVVVNCDWNR